MRKPRERLREQVGRTQDMRSREIDDEYVDLVCHHAVAVQNETASARWREDTYFFCSPFCRQRFRAEPSAFVPAQYPFTHSQTTTREFHATA